MENQGHKLDNLFKEKLSDMEIPLEEDYWPLIEKSLDAPVTSFYKFGWKHFNIYQLSISILLLFGTVYLLNKPKEQVAVPINPTIEQLPTGNAIDSASTFQPKVITPVKKQNSAINNNSVSKPVEIRQEADAENSTENSILKEEIVIPTPEPARSVVEEKPKAKRIIYVIQQDTIIEKDTVKVRRKRKN